METISKDALDTVTGANGSIPGGSSTAGATPTTGTGTGGLPLTGSGCGDPMFGMLQSLSSSIANLSKNNNSGFNSTDMMMFGMAMMMSRPEAPVYIGVGGGGGCGGHYGASWRRW